MMYKENLWFRFIVMYFSQQFDKNKPLNSYLPLGLRLTACAFSAVSPVCGSCSGSETGEGNKIIKHASCLPATTC